MKPWEGIVHIPEGKSGNYEIRHFTRPAGPIERSNLRTAIMGGQAEPPVHFDRKTTWHELSYEGGVWMTDLPIEQQQHDNELKSVVSGSVIVGGLGLGYAVNVLAAREGIERILVVEISRDVINLVEPWIRDPRDIVEVQNADLMEYVKVNEEGFDWAFYDIWQSDGERTFHEIVVPLREHSIGFIPCDSQVICWNENVMRGQLMQALIGRLMTCNMSKHPELKSQMHSPSLEDLSTPIPDHPHGGHLYHNWACDFFKAVKEKGWSIQESFPYARAYAGNYACNYFSRWWEEVVAGEIPVR